MPARLLRLAKDEADDAFEPVAKGEFLAELEDFVRNGLPRDGAGVGVELGSVALPVSRQVTVRYKASDVEPFDEERDASADDGAEIEELVALTIACNTTLGQFIPETLSRPVFDAWEEFVTTRNEQAAADGLAEAGLASLFHYTTTGLWRSMETEAVLAENAVFGVILSLVISFFIMLFSTLNIFVTLFAMFSVVGIVVTFLGIIVLIGWELGIIESYVVVDFLFLLSIFVFNLFSFVFFFKYSICITILTGLAIDFVLHIANAYNESAKHASRYERMSMAILEVGISVFSAAITTIGAATLLLFTTVIFFFRFEIFLRHCCASLLFNFCFSTIIDLDCLCL